MNVLLLWAALGLVPALPATTGGPCAACPQCECCGCCETGTCTCTKCGCECCVDGCPTAGVRAGQAGCCGGGRCGT